MKAKLGLLLLLPLTVFANTENLPVPASSTAPAGTIQTAPTAELRNKNAAAAPVRTRTEATAAFKADLLYCKSLPVEERRDCERETYAARAEGLYR